MNLLNLFDLVDAVAAQKSAEKSASIPPAVHVSQSDGQPATIVVPVATSDEVEVLEDGHEDSLDLGDEVIITGNVQFKGKTGRVVDFGSNKHFVVVDLYNFGKHSFHSSNVEHNDYADSEEEDADWQERDYGLFGDDEREEVAEGNDGYYHEQLAQAAYANNPKLSTSGRADDLVSLGFELAADEIGRKRARHMFAYDEDFASDFVSAYAELQREHQGVTEAKGLNKRVRVVKTGETGTIRQVKHGAFKGAAKTYYVDLDNGGQADNLPASALRLIKDDVAENTSVTDYNPKSHGGTRKELLAKYHKTKNPKDAEAARKAGATQKELQGVAEEYDPSYDPEYRGYQKPEQDPDAWKQERDLEEPFSKKTVVIKDAATGKEVARFPSTGGYYGDLRKSDELGFNFEQGDYDVKWVDSVREGNNWLDAPVSEDQDVDVGPALAAWKEQIKKQYPQLADWIKFFGKKDGQVSAEVPGRDRCYGVFDMNTGKGEILGD